MERELLLESCLVDTHPGGAVGHVSRCGNDQHVVVQAGEQAGADCHKGAGLVQQLIVALAKGGIGHALEKIAVAVVCIEIRDAECVERYKSTEDDLERRGRFEQVSRCVFLGVTGYGSNVKRRAVTGKVDKSGAERIEVACELCSESQIKKSDRLDIHEHPCQVVRRGESVDDSHVNLRGFPKTSLRLYEWHAAKKLGDE